MDPSGADQSNIEFLRQQYLDEMRKKVDADPRLKFVDNGMGGRAQYGWTLFSSVLVAIKQEL